MATKYRQFFDLMVTQNKELFDSFQKVHSNFIKEPKKWKTQFDELGRDVQDVVRDYENRLCRSSENSGYGRYTTELSVKFQQEVKKMFPKIDQVGADL
jgi:hypothetical protein